MRDRGWRRHKDFSKAKRKQAKARQYHNYKGYQEVFDWYDNLHQFSKNKIHCSCSLCACKTNNNKILHPLCGPAMNWSMMDQRRLDAMKFQIIEREIGEQDDES